MRSALDAVLVVSGALKAKHMARAAPAWASAPTPATPSGLFGLLPHEMTLDVLRHLGGADLGALSGTCRAMRANAATTAERLVRAMRRSLPDPAGSAAVPCWPRALVAAERLEVAVGPCPSHPWWREWAPMRVDEVRLLEGRRIEELAFMPGGALSIASLVQRYRHGLTWMLQAGWPLAHATRCMLLSAYCSSAMGASVREGSPRYAASTHALASTLQQRAWCITAAAPKTYASIDGTFGLCKSDPAWLALLDPDLAASFVGRSFVTSAPIQASADPTTLPAVPSATSGGGGGFPETVPLHRLSSAAFELRHGGGLVCFRSEHKPGANLLGLVQTSPTGYQLPPLATVTLEGVEQPGAWEVNGCVVWRRLFTVRVSVAV